MAKTKLLREVEKERQRQLELERQKERSYLFGVVHRNALGTLVQCVGDGRVAVGDDVIIKSYFGCSSNYFPESVKVTRGSVEDVEFSDDSSKGTIWIRKGKIFPRYSPISFDNIVGWNFQRAEGGRE